MNNHPALLYAANSLKIDPSRLKLVEVSTMPAMELSQCGDQIIQKECYRNAFNVASSLMLDVVIGATVLGDLGLAIEHAWVAEPGDGGRHFDPTFQIHRMGTGGDVYLELYRIPFDRYLDEMKSLESGRAAIDVATLRRHPRTKHLFSRHQQAAGAQA